MEKRAVSWIKGVLISLHKKKKKEEKERERMLKQSVDWKALLRIVRSDT